MAFDDDHGEPHRGFIISIDSHPDEPTVDVECADAVWKHVPVDRMRPDPQPPTFRPEPKKGDGPTARLYGWLASRAAAWMTTVIADGSIQEALDANEPDPEYRADWIHARATGGRTSASRHGCLWRTGSGPAGRSTIRRPAPCMRMVHLTHYKTLPTCGCGA